MNIADLKAKLASKDAGSRVSVERELVSRAVGSDQEALAERQAVAALAEAVRQLSDGEQQVIALRFVEGLPHRQVAEVIGKSAGASRMIQHRALAKLAELLGKGEASHGRK